VGWDGEGRERKGEEGRDGKRAGGKYCFMAVGGDGRHCSSEAQVVCIWFLYCLLHCRVHKIRVSYC
jgi:hypothetical protein